MSYNLNEIKLHIYNDNKLKNLNLSDDEIKKNFTILLNYIDRKNLCNNSDCANCDLIHSFLERDENGNLYEVIYKCKKQLNNTNNIIDNIVYHDLKQTQFFDIIKNYNHYKDNAKNFIDLYHDNDDSDDYVNKNNAEKIYTSIKLISSTFNLIKNNNKCIYLYGNQKSGKTTFLQFLLCILIIKLNKKLAYVKSNKLVEVIESNNKWNNNHDDINFIDMCKKIDILIIDDLGYENINSYVYGVYSSIIKHRIDNNKITIIASCININLLNNYFNKSNKNSHNQLWSNNLSNLIKNNFTTVNITNFVMYIKNKDKEIE